MRNIIWCCLHAMGFNLLPKCMKFFNIEWKEKSLSFMCMCKCVNQINKRGVSEWVKEGGIIGRQTIRIERTFFDSLQFWPTFLLLFFALNPNMMRINNFFIFSILSFAYSCEKRLLLSILGRFSTLCFNFPYR